MAKPVTPPTGPKGLSRRPHQSVTPSSPKAPRGDMPQEPVFRAPAGQAKASNKPLKRNPAGNTPGIRYGRTGSKRG